MNPDWNAFSNHLAALVRTRSDAVVRVQAGRRPSSGTIWRDDLVVTTNHSLRRDTDVAVAADDGAARPASLVGRDPTTDLALLRVDGLPASAPRAAADVAAGHLVLALGRPGRTVQVTWGMVRAAAGDWQTPAGGRVDRWIDVDGSLPHGFTGGPLVDLSGGVAGLNTANLVRGGTTLPAATVDRVVDELLAHGTRRPGWLGVMVQRVAAPAGDGERTPALLVTAVEPGSPADTAGVRLGDVLLRVNGAALAHHGDLLAALAGQAGRPLTVAVARGGDEREVAVTAGERPSRSDCCP